MAGLTGGINSGVEPLLLDRSQLSMAVNVSLRGGFAKTRPPVQKKTLVYSSPELQALVEFGVFQGAGYYRPDYGTESLIAAISGHIILFTEAGSSWLVTDVSVPGDLLSTTAPQVWMWQSELWMIISDGSGSLPIFFNGSTSRRSYGGEVVLGNVIPAGYIPPAIGSTVTLSLTSAYTGQYNIPVLLNGEFYQPIQNVAGYSAILTNVNDTAGNTVASGTQVVVQPNLVGSITAVTVLQAHEWRLTMTSVANLNQMNGILISGNFYTLVLVSGLNIIVSSSTSPMPVVGQYVFSAGSSAPSIVLGTTTQAFNVPAIGSTVNVVLSAPYTGTVGTLVTVGGNQYTIAPSSSGTGSTSLIVINLTDTDINPVTIPANLVIYSVPELPAGRMGAYGMGRNWMCLTDGISYIAGDIVGGASGTAASDYRDSVLKTTENTFLAGGGTFRLPGTGDIITSMVFPPVLDTSLGQGQLQIFTAFSAFSNNSPVDRTTWESLTSPLQTESLKDNGALGQNNTVLLNSDTFFRSPVGIGSLVLARRDFIYGNAWGNKPVSNELNRVLELDNQSLLSFGSAVSFDNRFFSTCSPTVSGQGIFHSGFITLNNDLISSLRTSVPSAWEGAWSGINTLQVLAGRVNGVRRCFAFTFNAGTSTLELHELLAEAVAEQAGIYQDSGSVDIEWFFETAVLFNKDVKQFVDFIRLNNGEISLSDIQGTVTVNVLYRPLFFPCWIPWHSFTVCANTNVTNGQKQYRYRLGLGTPDGTNCDPVTNTPYREGLAFQFRVEITGSCTFQDLKVEAVEIPMPKFAPVVCDSTEAVVSKCQPLVCVNTPDLNYSIQGAAPPPD